MGDEAGEGGDQAAAAAADRALAVLVALEPAAARVRDDDQWREGAAEVTESGVDVRQQGEPVAQKAGRRTARRACSLPARPSRLPDCGSARISRLRWAHSEGELTRKPISPCLDLQRNAADVVPPIVGRPFQKRLGDGQAEALADRLPKADVGLRLEGVDLDRADVVEVVEDLDVGVVDRLFRGLLEVLAALGVVAGHRADHRQLRLRDLLGDLAVGVDDTDRVLQVESRDLGDQRPVGSIPNWRLTKAASSGEKAMFFGESGSIAGGMMLTPSRPAAPIAVGT